MFQMVATSALVAAEYLKSINLRNLRRSSPQPICFLSRRHNFLTDPAIHFFGDFLLGVSEQLTGCYQIGDFAGGLCPGVPELKLSDSFR